MLDLIIKNGDCFINGKLEKKDIGIVDGKIAQIEHSSRNLGASNLPNSQKTTAIRFKASKLWRLYGNTGPTPFNR